MKYTIDKLEYIVDIQIGRYIIKIVHIICILNSVFGAASSVLAIASNKKYGI